MGTENWMVINRKVSIAGRVLDSISKNPLQGGLITIESRSFKNITVSGGDGAYYFLDVPKGNYKMTARTPSHQLMYGTWEKNDIDLPISDQIQRINVNIELAPTCLKGTVRNDQKEPAPVDNAMVRLWGNSEGVVCDRNGNYLLEPIMSGNPMIEVFAKGYESQRLTVSGVETGETRQFDIVLLKTKKQNLMQGDK